MGLQLGVLLPRPVLAIGDSHLVGFLDVRFVNLGTLWVSISLVGDWVGVLSFIGLGVNLFVSSNANDWRRRGLIDHGYKVRAEMAGPTKAFVLAELRRHARDNG